MSDDSGQLELIPVFRGRISRDGLEPSDVNFMDTEDGLYIYIGPTASARERRSIWQEAEVRLNFLLFYEKVVLISQNSSLLFLEISGNHGSPVQPHSLHQGWTEIV